MLPSFPEHMDGPSRAGRAPGRAPLVRPVPRGQNPASNDAPCPSGRGDTSRWSKSIIAVTGLAFEARIAGGVTIVGDDLRSGTGLSTEMARGGRGIISFGIGGGLADDLAPGQWIVASSVISGAGRHRADDGWSQSILQALPGARHGTVAGVDLPVADPEAKRALHRGTGAIIVDTESHLVARLASAYDVPFAVCRVVVDPAHRTLAPAALLDLLPGGTPDVRAILRSVAAKPSQLPLLAQLAIDAFIARLALRRARMHLGPDLGFPYFSDRNVERVETRADDRGPAANFTSPEITPA
jgi:adenosylhomocysteine nucleosidase